MCIRDRLEAVYRALGEAAQLHLIRHVDAFTLHFDAARGAHAGTYAHDVEEQAVQFVAQQFDYFRGLSGKVVVVTGVDAQRLIKAGFTERAALVCAVGLAYQPFRMRRGALVVPLHGYVHRRIDALAVQCAHLFDHQIAVFQVRVHALREAL